VLENPVAWRRVIGVLVTLLFAVLGAGGAPAIAAADTTPTAPPIARPANAVPGSYIVTLRGAATDTVGTANRLARAHGGEVTHVYRAAIDGFAVRLSDQQADALRTDPAVKGVFQDGVVHAAATQTPAPWHLDRIDQRDLPLDNAYTYDGGGAAVHAYVLDTGIRVTHTDFGGRASVGDDEIGGGVNGLDCNGHGTHVAGILGGATSGVAKGVQLVSVRVLDCTGSGTFSSVIAGVDWVTAHAVKPAVANMSLSGGAFAPLDDAIDESIASGVVYAAAAGNSGADACGASPGRDPQVLSAGATDPSDTRASFSNVGTCVSLFAPGVNIVSDSNASDTAQMVLSGTSMASPVLAGIAAGYLDRYPDAAPAEVKSAIVQGATSGHVIDAGTGSPNLLAFASLPPRPDTVVAVGASSTEFLMDRALGAGAVDVHARPTTNVLAPADGHCASVTYGPSASSAVVPPASADAGRDALRDSVAGTYPNSADDSGRGCVDIARSDADPRAIGTDDAAFRYFAFGIDAVTWASPSLDAPAAMTLADLRRVFSCQVTDWSQLPGGGTGPIRRALPPSGSGTRHNFVTRLLGQTDTSSSPWVPPTGPGCPAPVVLPTESAGFELAHDPVLRGESQAYVLPYSAALWVHQANNAANPSLDVRSGVRPGAIRRDATDPVAPALAVGAVRWLGSSWRLNDATVVGGRVVAGATADAQFDASITAAPGSFTANDVGLTVQGAIVNDGTVITAVSSDGATATISPGATRAGTASIVVGSPAVGERNPNVLDPADGSVFAGVHYVYNVVDTASPSAASARALVGFDDIPGGLTSALCRGDDQSMILDAGFLDLVPADSPGGNTGVVCRVRTP
jgi:subtilisin family serine protease